MGPKNKEEDREIGQKHFIFCPKYFRFWFSLGWQLNIEVEVFCFVFVNIFPKTSIFIEKHLNLHLRPPLPINDTRFLDSCCLSFLPFSLPPSLPPFLPSFFSFFLRGFSYVPLSIDHIYLKNHFDKTFQKNHFILSGVLKSWEELSYF